MSEELGYSSLRLCELCERSCDTTKERVFIDPYSKQSEEFTACDDCYEDVRGMAYESWEEDFGIRERGPR